MESSKPAPKRLRASVTSRVRDGIKQESNSTSESDTIPVDSYESSTGDAVDTPATAISSRSSSSAQNKGKGKAVAAPGRRVSTRLSAKVADSQDEDGDEHDERAEELEYESELSELEYEDEDEDEEDGEDDEEYEEDEIAMPLPKGKGKGKGKAASRTSSVALTAAAATDMDDGGSLSDLSEGTTEEFDRFTDTTDAGTPREPAPREPARRAPVRAAPVPARGRRQRAVRQPRVWGGRRTRVCFGFSLPRLAANLSYRRRIPATSSTTSTLSSRQFGPSSMLNPGSPLKRTNSLTVFL